jgi:tetratricopeptide (TPR) repeat protein
MGDNLRIDDLRRRVERDPASIAFAQLAEEYRRAGQPRESIETCRVGLARHPGYLSARVTLGRALLELGQLDEAQHELELVLKSAPENLAALRGLAEVHHVRGSLAEALTYYRAALALARNDPDLDETVADLTRQLAPKKRPDPEDGLSIEQMQQELSIHAGPLTPRTPPHPVPAAAPDRPIAPTVLESPQGKPSAPLQSASTVRALHTIAALERWLSAIVANHVTRTQSRA